MASDKQVIDIPLMSGLSSVASGQLDGADSRTMQAPGFAICRNAVFDVVDPETGAGGIRKRKPIIPITDAVGNTIANFRRLATYNDELVAFTKNHIWSYEAGGGKWTKRGVWTACEQEEAPRFVNTAEQYDCDRAELNGVALFCWTQDINGTVTSWVAGISVADGSVVLTPEQVGASGAIRPRLIACDAVMWLTWMESTTTHFRRYTDMASLSTYTATSQTLSTAAAYDVVRDADDDLIVAIARGANGYTLSRVRGSSTVVVIATATVATATDIIAIAREPTNDDIGLFRANGTAILGDLRQNDATFTTIAAGIAVGTAEGAVVNQITCVFKDVLQSGYYRCYGAWSSDESETAVAYFATERAYIIGDGTASAILQLGRRCGLASHAFLRDGVPMVWLAFARASGASGVFTAVQNGYFLMGMEAIEGWREIHAKAAQFVAGGYAATTGALPGVQNLGDERFAWCGVERRILNVGLYAEGYSARAPREIITTFDSDAARRTVQLGNTLYISGGFVAQYDGQALTEVNYHNVPGAMSAAPGGVGTLDVGDYFYKQSILWQNAAGEQDQGTGLGLYEYSTPGSEELDLEPTPVHLTAKHADNFGCTQAVLEIYRSLADPATFDAPMYLITDPDPSASALADNGHLRNAYNASTALALTDSLTDANAALRRQFPDGGSVLTSLSPPPATVIAASQDRIFIAGIAGHPHRIAYSKLRDPGMVAAFNDYLTVDLPAEGGAITALTFLNETLIAFKERAIYAVPGDGFDNTGGGANYGPARLIASDVGAVSADAVGVTPLGVIFKSSKGWYLLDRGWSPQYIGRRVAAFDGDEVKSVTVMEDRHQVRCLTDEAILVWDYRVNQWSEWTVADGLDAKLWGGVYHVIDGDDDEVLAEATSWVAGAEAIALELETAWIKVAGLQGAQSVRRVLILGEYQTAHVLNVKVAKDYDEEEGTGLEVNWSDEKTWTPTPATAGAPLRLIHGPSFRRCQAIKIWISDGTVASPTTGPVGEGFRLSGLALEVGIKRGPFTRIAAAQKQ